MTDVAHFASSLSTRHYPNWVRLISLAGVALLLIGPPMFAPIPAQWGIGMMAIGASFLSVGLIVMVRAWLDYRTEAATKMVLSSFLEKEPAPGFIADGSGRILIANSHARNRFKAMPGMRLDHCLRSLFANPAAILVRLQSRAAAYGRTTEEIVTKGPTIPVLTVDLGNDLFLWRIKADGHRQWAQVPIPVFTLGRNDVVLTMNPAAQEFAEDVQFELADVLPKGWSGQPAIVRVPTGSRSRRICVVELRKTSAGREVAVIELNDKPTEPWTATVADLPVPILHLSLTGEILDANPLAVKLVGDCEIGRSKLDVMMQGLNRPVSELLAAVAAKDGPPRSEFVRLTRKEREIFVQITLTRVVFEGEVGLIAVLNDATELKTLEAQFVQGQKMQAVGQLAGGVAHDFNNLLTAISGHCDLLLLRHGQQDPDYGDLVQIHQNANRAAALVGQLLAFSRKQTLRPEVLDLRDTISDLIHLLNRLVGEKVRLVLSHDPVLKPVRADKRQLEQVLMNLVVNARDAMPDGGEVRIETEIISLSEPLLRDRTIVPSGEYAAVKVIDSGVGIPPDKQQKIFEPFYTTKRTGEGTGLGLSTVYGIVKQTGGFIFVDSTPGRGSEFVVMLPVCAVEKEIDPVDDKQSRGQSTGQGEGVVLLVEDEAPVRAFATRALRLKGFTVLEAESAEDALRILEDPDLHVDVFVTDVVMPGMDGPTWVEKARETRPTVRVVFMSGYTEGAFGEAGPEVSNSVFLPKPFSLTQLIESVVRQLP